VVLLLHADGTGNAFVDSSPYAHAITANGSATQSAAQSKWGGKALSLNGNGDYLAIASTADFAIGNTFVVEGWIYFNSFPAGLAAAYIADFRVSATTQYTFGAYTSSGLLYVAGGGSAIQSNTGLTLNTWQHFAFVNNAGSLSMYIDGTRVGTGTLTLSQEAAPLTIGARYTKVTEFVNGYIDDLRVTKGSTRGYTGASIPVPTTPFPDALQTSSSSSSSSSRSSSSSSSSSSVAANPQYVPIPIMTSATTPSGVVSDNGILAAGVESWHAFDKETVNGDTTFYVSPYPPNGYWIQYDFGYPTMAGGYEITSRQLSPFGNTQAPRSWVMSGSTDGVNFTEISRITNQNWVPSGERKTFYFSSPQAFRYWRWTWGAANGGGDAVLLPKIQLLDYLPGAPTGLSGAAGDQRVVLGWTAPSKTGSSDITDYTIEYSSNSGSSWTTFSHAASTMNYATVTGLTNSTAYIFRVTAINAQGAGPSAVSNSFTPTASSFTPVAVMLTSGTSYTVPAGATSMKAWAIGAGNNNYAPPMAGGCAYKTWPVSGGQTVSYQVGSAGNPSSASTVTFSGTTITGYQGGSQNGTNGTYAGGDGGANGGLGTGDYYSGSGIWGGAVGGNSGAATAGKRRRAADVAGLFVALALAGVKTVEDDGATPAFGSGAWNQKYASPLSAGRGGSGVYGASSGAGAVVLYFT